MAFRRSLSGKSYKVLVDCVNCGKQVECDTSEDNCYWCGNPVRIKVNSGQKAGNSRVLGIQVSQKTTEEAEMRKGGNLQAKHRFIEEHKAEIIADFISLGAKEMLVRWEVSASGWATIKRRWAAEIEEARGKAPETVVIEKTSPASQPLDYKQLYYQLLENYKGYRQAVLDICGQKPIEDNSKKE